MYHNIFTKAANIDFLPLLTCIDELEKPQELAELLCWHGLPLHFFDTQFYDLKDFAPLAFFPKSSREFKGSLSRIKIKNNARDLVIKRRDYEVEITPLTMEQRAAVRAICITNGIKEAQRKCADLIEGFELGYQHYIRCIHNRDDSHVVLGVKSLNHKNDMLKSFYMGDQKVVAKNELFCDADIFVSKVA